MARSTSQLENREAMRNFSDQHSSQKRKASFDASPMPSSATVQSMRPHTSGMPPQPFVSHQGRDYDSEPRPRSQGDRWHEDSNKRRREHERWSPERQPASGLPAARESMEEHVRYTGGEYARPSSGGQHLIGTAAAGPSYSAASSNAGSSHERRFYPGEEQQRHAYDREQSQAQRHHVATSSSHPHYLRGDGVDRGYPSGHGLPTSRSYPSPSNRHEQYREEQHGQYGRYPGGPDERDAGSNGGAPNARKRGKLPKAVTDLLKSWLLEHATHPYPTDEEKRRLCAATGLTMSQVSNWVSGPQRVPSLVTIANAHTSSSSSTLGAASSSHRPRAASPSAALLRRSRCARCSRPSRTTTATAAKTLATPVRRRRRAMPTTTSSTSATAADESCVGSKERAVVALR
jgi:hypothetical protein